MALITSVDEELLSIPGGSLVGTEHDSGHPLGFFKLLKRGIACGRFVPEGSGKPDFYQYDLMLRDVPYFRINETKKEASLTLSRASRDALVKALQAIDFDEKP